MTDERAGVPGPPKDGRALPVPRRFRDDEVAGILRRAAAEETRPDLPAPHDPTLDDLMAVGAEAGLDPADIRRAAAIEPATGGGAAAIVFGAPDRREVRAFLADTDVPEERHTLVRTAARALGRSGTVVENAPGGFRWQERHLGGSTSVELATALDGIELVVATDRAGHYVGTWFVAFLVWAALSALTPLGSLAPLAAGLGFVIGPVLLARPFWKRSDTWAVRRLERLTMDLIRAVEMPGD